MMSMGLVALVVLVVLLVLVLVLFVAGYRFLALLLLLVLLGLWAYLRLERRAAVQALPSAPVVLPSDGGLYPDGYDGFEAVLH
jgi:hypothetical protein